MRGSGAAQCSSRAKLGAGRNRRNLRRASRSSVGTRLHVFWMRQTQHVGFNAWKARSATRAASGSGGPPTQLHPPELGNAARDEPRLTSAARDIPVSKRERNGAVSEGRHRAHCLKSTCEASTFHISMPPRARESRADSALRPSNVPRPRGAGRRRHRAQSPRRSGAPSSSARLPRRSRNSGRVSASESDARSFAASGR